ncbi:MAG: hypothetical protein FWD68_13210 [Alphaproteobacteria bacterium]|nr:hypothetical protein [Alphaproteobacteria bacterium]
MGYFYVEPEVAGALGDRTVMDRSVHPPIVKRLNYHLEGWLGDAILESFPIFIATTAAKDQLLKMGATGVVFDELDMTISDQFRELYPDRDVPVFVWLKPEGKAGHDDFGAAIDGRLVVSKRVLDMFDSVGLANALVEPFAE